MDEQSLFFEALEKKEPAERAAFLDEMCANDPARRDRIQNLLKRHEQAGGILPPPVSVIATTEEPREGGLGTVIGRYKLLEQIGEGGFGIVFMALQHEPIQRKVALKVLKAGMDSMQVIARFEAERQALALMDHPNIARILDAGTTGESEPRTSESGPLPLTDVRGSGRPYFVMDLVKGLPMTHYCDQARLTTRERLELFVSLCQAVQHAHQKGIIHRDIKPSNVLVTQQDGKAMVKVIDFGIAKALGQQLTDKTVYTGFAQMIGTPLYMSPEQAALSNVDVDTRSDVYSMGVLLYELLTGTTPFDKKRLREMDYDEMRRVIREEEPPKPSTRISTLGQASTTASSNRKSDPKRLSQLIRGELDWIVMKALEKDRNRRYESASAFAADVQRYLNDEPVLACPPSAGYRCRKFARRNRMVLAVAGLVLFFIALLGGVGGWVVRDRLARQAKAVNELEQALDRGESFLGQGKRAEALSALERAELLAGQVPADPARSERLAALKERLAAEARDQEFLARFAEIQLRMQSQHNPETGLFSAQVGFPEIRDALKQYGIIIGVTETSEVASYIQGRPDPVRLNLIAALEECFKWAPLDDAQLGRWLRTALAAADNDPWRGQVRKAAAGRDWKALEQLALQVEMGKQAPSFLISLTSFLPPQMRATRLVLFRRIQRAHPDDLWANHRLGHELVYSAKPAEAVRYFTAALALQPRSAGMYLNRGESMRLAGEVDAAIVDFRRALELSPRNALAFCALADALRSKGRHDEALAECREAIRVTKDIPAARNVLAGAYNLLGACWAEKGQIDEAVSAFRTAVQINKDNPQAHNNLGYALSVKGKLDDSIAAFRAAIQLNKEYTQAHYHLGNVLSSKGELKQAVAEFSGTVALDPKHVLAFCNRGRAYRRLGEYEKAYADYQTALKLAPSNSWVYNALAWLLATCPDPRLRNPARAVDFAKKAVQLASQDGNSWISLGVAEYRAREYKAAILALERCLKLDPGADAAVLFFLAMAHGKLNHRDEARKWYDRGVAWLEKHKEPLEKDKPIAEDMRRFRTEAAAVLEQMNNAAPNGGEAVEGGR
jgi:serine/threonine protein kinase/Tfp pilus assembly protein PilF